MKSLVEHGLTHLRWTAKERTEGGCGDDDCDGNVGVHAAADTPVVGSADVGTSLQFT